MILIINTADESNFQIALIKNNKIIKLKNFQAKYRLAEKLLPAFDDLLKKSKTKLSKIKGIIVAVGPGSFSSLRIGISLANTLGWALKVPVAGIKPDEFYELEKLAKIANKIIKKAKINSIIKPHYGKEPNITKPKTQNLNF